MVWIEPLCDPNCNVTVNVLDLSLDMLLKINEFRKIKQAFETIQYEEAQREMNSRG